MPPPPGGMPPGPGTPYGYQPYGGGPWGYAAVHQHPNGTSILVFGILSIVVCGVFGPVAWTMGNKAVREMDAQPGVTWSNRGNVTAGRVCGIIGSCLLALQILWLLVVVGLFASAGF